MKNICKRMLLEVIIKNLFCWTKIGYWDHNRFIGIIFAYETALVGFFLFTISLSIERDFFFNTVWLILLFFSFKILFVSSSKLWIEIVGCIFFLILMILINKILITQLIKHQFTGRRVLHWRWKRDCYFSSVSVVQCGPEQVSWRGVFRTLLNTWDRAFLWN